MKNIFTMFPYIMGGFIYFDGDSKKNKNNEYINVETEDKIDEERLEEYRKSLE